MLTVAQQGGLLKLAVFQGGFGRPAAQQVAGATLPLLVALMDELYAVYRTSAWLQEGYAAFKTAVTQVSHPPELQAKLQARQGSLAINLGQFEEAMGLLAGSLGMIRPLNEMPGLAFILQHLSRVAYLRSDYDQTRQFAQESFQRYDALNRPR